MDEEYFELMDAETVNQDFDDIDLYGEKLIEDEDDSNIEFEYDLSKFFSAIKTNGDDVLTYNVSFVISN